LTHDQPWGWSRLIAGPTAGSVEHIVVIEAELAPGQAHGFHRHSDQDEVILVLAGAVEQWIDRTRRRLSTGDSAHVARGVVHATFNVGPDPARLLILFGPARGALGFEMIDVSTEPPWSTLRG
jgi:quercetin dioxygenase-like cupin family protein